MSRHIASTSLPLTSPPRRPRAPWRLLGVPTLYHLEPLEHYQLFSATPLLTLTAPLPAMSQNSPAISIDATQSGALPPPIAPTNVHANATASSSQIKITWSDNAADETGYEIQAASLYWGTWGTIGTVGPDATSFVETNVTPGATFQYRVRALGTDADSDWSNDNPAFATTLLAHDPSKVIHAADYQDSGGSFYNFQDGVAMWDEGSWLKFSAFDFSSNPINSFSAATSGPGSGDAFDIHLDSPSGPLLGTLGIPSTTDWSTYQNATTSLAPATGIHDVYVVYRSAGGSHNVRSFSFGPNHAPVNTTPGAQVLNENSSLVFSALNSDLISTTDSDDDGNPLQITLSVSHGTLTLGHTDNLTFLSGDGTSDSSMTFTGGLSSLQYALSWIQYSPTANFTGADLLTLTTDDQGFTGSGGVQSDTDTIALNVTSSYVPPPAAPTDPFANATPTAVTLTWSDNSNVESGFEIQRSSGGYTNDWSTVGTVAANVTTFTDSTVAPGTAYKYRVRAVNSSGASAFTGDWSAVVTTSYLHDITAPWRLPHYEQTTSNGSNWGGGMSVGPDGSWYRYSSFNFSAATVTALTVASSGPITGNQLEVHLDSPTGTQIGVVTLNGSGDYSTVVLSTGAIAPTTGIHDVYLVYREPVGWGNLLYSASFGPNLPPVNTIPAPQLLLADTPLVFSGPNGNRISTTDPDNLDTRLRVTLTATHGVIALASTTGLSIITGTGANDTTVTVEGVPSDLNAALNGLSFTPATGFTGLASITMTTNDLGFTGNGGPQLDTDTLAIHVLASLSPPADPSALRAVATSTSAITLTWSDSANDNTAFEIQRAAWGTTDWATIATPQPTDASYTDNTLTPDSSYQYRIRAVSDTGFSNWTTPAVATTRITHSVLATYTTDLYQDSSGVHSTFTGGVSGIEDHGWIMFSNVDFSANPAAGFTITASTPVDAGFLEIHIDSPTGTQIGQVALTHAPGAADLRAITASIAAVTGIHDVYLVYDQANGAVPTFYGFTFATNRPPVNAVPLAQTIPEGHLLTFSANNGNAIAVSDPDAGSAVIQVTLSVTHGVLTLGQTSALTFLAGDGAGDTTMTFRGTTWDITNALSGLTYTPDFRFVGDAALSIATDDLGNTGAGGPQQADNAILIHVAVALTPPVVAAPASSTPAGPNALALNVLGGDQDGEQVLVYHWTAIRQPAGAQVTFTNNDTNAAKATAAMVDRAGSYTFQVTISDGVSVTTSSVSIVVKAPPVSNPPAGPAAPPPPDAPGPIGPHGPDSTPGLPPLVDPPTQHPGPSTPGKPGPAVNPPPVGLTTARASSSDSASSGNADAGRAAHAAPTSAAPSANNAPSAPAVTPTAAAAPTLTASPTFHDAAATLPPPPRTITPTDLAKVPPPSPTVGSLKITELADDTVDASPIQTTLAPQLAQELKKSEQQLQETQRTVQRVVGTIVGVSATATSVCIIWLARGGSLLLSMLTSVPMWRYLDPLPVLDTTPVAKRRRRWHWPWRSALKVVPDTTDQPIEELIG